MRVRVALAAALLIVLGGLALDMSGRAPRLAGGDHINPVGFVASIPSGGTLCQPVMVLPADAQRVEMLVGTYGHPMPRIQASFTSSAGRKIATGQLAAGAPEGNVRVPLGYPHGPTVVGTLCLRIGRVAKPIVLAGDIFTAGPSSERIDGRLEGGRIAVTYLRPGRESWWQLLGGLDERFGLGKASFFGDWTLPAMALLLLGAWIATVRLLVRELRA